MPADWAMTPEKFLADDTPPPIDEEEIREALAQALRDLAPPALIRLVGRQAYTRSGALLIAVLVERQKSLQSCRELAPPALIRLVGRLACTRSALGLYQSYPNASCHCMVGATSRRPPSSAS